MFSEGGVSLADIAAVTGNNNGGWGENGIWAILLLALLGRNGNGLWGGNDGNGGGAYPYPYPYPVFPSNGGYSAGVATSADIERAFDNQTVLNKLNGLEDTTCTGFAGVNNNVMTGFNRLQNNANQGFAGLNTVMVTQGYETQNAINNSTNALMGQLTANATQQASCCCDLKSQVATGFGDTAYRMATDTCSINTNMSNVARDITDNQNENTRAILAAIQAQADAAKDAKIADQASQIFALQLAASQQAQNNYIVNQLRTPQPIPAYVVSSPYASYNQCGGCGCGAVYGAVA